VDSPLNYVRISLYIYIYIHVRNPYGLMDIDPNCPKSAFVTLSFVNLLFSAACAKKCYRCVLSVIAVERHGWSISLSKLYNMIAAVEFNSVWLILGVKML
jgi:hypothetical protein